MKVLQIKSYGRARRTLSFLAPRFPREDSKQGGVAGAARGTDKRSVGCTCHYRARA